MEKVIVIFKDISTGYSDFWIFSDTTEKYLYRGRF